MGRHRSLLLAAAETQFVPGLVDWSVLAVLAAVLAVDCLRRVRVSRRTRTGRW